MHTQYRVLLRNMQAKQERIKFEYHKRANFIASCVMVHTTLKFYNIM